MLTRAQRLSASIEKRKKDPALALLVGLAKRVRYARKMLRYYRRVVDGMEKNPKAWEKHKDVKTTYKELLIEAIAVERELWNALQGSKEYYGFYTQKENPT